MSKLTAVEVDVKKVRKVVELLLSLDCSPAEAFGILCFSLTVINDYSNTSSGQARSNEDLALEVSNAIKSIEVTKATMQ